MSSEHARLVFRLYKKIAFVVPCEWYRCFREFGCLCVTVNCLKRLLFHMSSVSKGSGSQTVVKTSGVRGFVASFCWCYLMTCKYSNFLLGTPLLVNVKGTNYGTSKDMRIRYIVTIIKLFLYMLSELNPKLSQAINYQVSYKELAKILF